MCDELRQFSRRSMDGDTSRPLELTASEIRKIIDEQQAAYHSSHSAGPGQPAQLQTQREIPAMIDRIFSAVAQQRSVIQEVIERTESIRQPFPPSEPKNIAVPPNLSPMVDQLRAAREQIEACTEDLSTLLESLQL